MAAGGALEKMAGNKAVIHGAVFEVNSEIAERIGGADFMGKKSQVNAICTKNFMGLLILI